MKDSTVRLIEKSLPANKKRLARELYENYGLEAMFTQNPSSLYEEISLRYGTDVADSFINTTCLND